MGHGWRSGLFPSSADVIPQKPLRLPLLVYSFLMRAYVSLRTHIFSRFVLSQNKRCYCAGWMVVEDSRCLVNSEMLEPLFYCICCAHERFFYLQGASEPH